MIAPAAPMAPPHVSPWTGVLFLLEGRITVVVGGTSYDVEPGGLVILPAGTPATFGVVGESARFLAITSGDGAGRFFADFASSVPVDQPAEDSMAAILSVTKRHGVALAGARADSPPSNKERGDRMRSVAATGDPDVRLAAVAGALVAALLGTPATAAVHLRARSTWRSATRSQRA